MTKRRLYSTAPEKDRRIIVRVSARDVERKIRKPHAPVTKLHASKKNYRRKAKHPKRAEE